MGWGRTVRGLGSGGEGAGGAGRGGKGGLSGFGGEVDDIVVVVVGSRNPLKLQNDSNEKPLAKIRTKKKQKGKITI